MFTNNKARQLDPVQVNFVSTGVRNTVVIVSWSAAVCVVMVSVVCGFYLYLN